MKKIQILTFARGDNYGAVLQSYGLAETLRRMGFYVEFLALKKRQTWRYAIISNISPLKRGFDDFRKKYLKAFTKPASNGEELRQAATDSDCCIVGSDQVWNPNITSVRTPFYFFSFLPKNKRRISYAASFGTDRWNHPELVTDVKIWLKDFHAISVRENAGVEICKNTFGVNARKVLDPTLLLGDFEAVLTKPKYKNFIVGFMFRPSREYYNSLRNLSITLSSKVLLMDLPSRAIKPEILQFSLSPFTSVRNWVTNIANASIVITDSFHCMVFAILFKRDFYYIVNNKQLMSRITTLLEDLKLTDHIIEGPQAFCEFVKSDEFKHRKPIDYDSVHTTLKLLRSVSMQYLYDALSDI